MKDTLKNKLIQKFKLYESSLNGESKSNDFKIKKNAITQFEVLGFPTLKHEDWKYTNLAPINNTDYHINPDKVNIDIYDIEHLFIPNLDVDLIVLINGNFDESLSNIKNNENIEISSLIKAKANNKNLLDINENKHPFVLINKSFVQDGAYIKINKNIRAERPIHIVSISSSNQPILTNTQNYIEIGESSEASIIYSHYGLKSTICLSNNLNKIICNKNSKLEYNNLQIDSENSSQVNFTEVQQEADSIFTDNSLTISGKFIRNDIKNQLLGNNSSSNFNGIYFTNKKDHLDNHSLVEHKVPNCTSNELYKGIIDQRGKVVFNGKVLVHKNAQKTNAYQSNKNIILTDTASINTKPELEIYADDVKCSHGTTTGKLDEEALFYLTQRGINKEYAKAMLMFTFVFEVINKISIYELKKFIEDKIETKLLG